MRIIIVLVLLILSTASTFAQRADDIISSYVAFIGGRTAWKKVKTITASGEFNYGGMPFPFTTYAKAPDRYKLMVPFNGKFYAQAFDGKKGWKLDAFKDETKATWLEGSEAKAMANEADIELESPLIDYKTKKHIVSLEKKDTAAGKTCHVIKLTRNTGEVEHYYFDDQNYSLVMKLAPSRNAELQRAMLRMVYSDYRVVDGIKLPFKIACDNEGQMILTITTSEVFINRDVEEKQFQP